MQPFIIILKTKKFCFDKHYLKFVLMPHLKSHGGSNQTFPIMIYTEPKEKTLHFYNTNS